MGSLKWLLSVFYSLSCFLQPQFSSTPASVSIPVSQRQVLGSLASQENIRQQVGLTRSPELGKLATYPGSVCFYCLRGRAWTRLYVSHFFHNTVQWETLEGENFCEFRGFVAMYRSFLCKIWECGVFWWYKRTICASFLYQFAKVFSLESFLLYSISLDPSLLSLLLAS